ncbi:hypothetical protein TNCV_733251 [Trichonephila clavipes]|nr:hypothetical protein TNCV_733251 [Trichonephila clavipes]
MLFKFSPNATLRIGRPGLGSSLSGSGASPDGLHCQILAQMLVEPPSEAITALTNPGHVFHKCLDDGQCDPTRLRGFHYESSLDSVKASPVDSPHCHHINT